MYQEAECGQVKEALVPQGYQVESFQIADADSSLRWTNDIWPQLTTIFDTTPGWENLSTSRGAFYQEIVQLKDGAALLLKNGESIIGVSFIYPMDYYLRSKDEIFYPSDGKTAYNSSVIVAPAYRSQKLVIPLLEDSMQEASHLGYNYMVGHYNAQVGQMPDGRFVHKGFAHSLKQNTWIHGEIIPPTVTLLSHDSTGKAEPVENIIFRLKQPQYQRALSPARRGVSPAMVS